MDLPKFLTQPKTTIYRSNNYVVLDFETTSYSKGSALDNRNGIVGVARILGRDHPSAGINSGIQYYRSSEFELGHLVREVQEAGFIIAHNAKFELQWLERCGVELGSVLVFDTMIAEYVLGGNQWRHAAVSLNNCARRNFGEQKIDIIGKMMDAGVPVEDIPESWLEEYCKKDVYLTHRLFQLQRKRLEIKELEPVMYTRCLLTPVLAEIEKHGMQLDASRVNNHAEEIERSYAQLEQRMDLLLYRRFHHSLH